VAAGIGFVGAGAILKMSEQGQILGLTTAASIWMTAATGVAAGSGRVGLAVTGAILAVIVLRLFPFARPSSPVDGGATPSA
jgi:putative Mg2+ transporter-C (MgtC) family protein